ncbi:hypothetical protein BH23GEM11_BH23GEM11_04340 [soil metagenome]
MMTRHPFMRLARTAPMAMLAVVAIAACDRQQVVAPEETISEQRAHAGPATISNANVVRVIARHDGPDYVFDLSDEVIPSGWTTFEMDNHSSSTHFMYLARVPQGAMDGALEDDMELLEYWETHVTRPFQFFMDTMIEDKELRFGDAPTKYEETFFPPWFFEAVPMGGPGFTQGHLSSRTTVNLAPGYYIVECYVKNADGDFHSYDGMISLLEVTEERSGANEPRATLHVNLSTGQIDVDENIRPGLHTVAVHFDEQPAGGYEHLLGHDVHLIRLDDEWTAEETAEWMSWMVPDGLVSADGMRGPSTFMGGAQTMAAGNTAYFTVRLEPGQYAWVSEVPAIEGMWETFSVPFGSATGGR